MQRRVINPLTREQTNSNWPLPALQRTAVAIDQPPQRNAAAANAQRPTVTGHHEPWLRNVMLSQLRMGNEHRHELVKAPLLPSPRLAAPSVPEDAASQHLTGRDYLEFLSTDVRLLVGIRELIAGHQILAANPPLPSERINNIAERLRPIVAEIYHDAQNRNEDRARGYESTLATEVEDLADDASTWCGDRLELNLRQMEDIALVARLSRGDIDEVALYNHGVAYFMLDRAIGEIGREATAHGAAAESQSVMAHLEAIYFLQDTLPLPHRQARPQYYGQGISFMTEDIARTIGNRVREAATERDGEHVIQFMSTWAPWVRHMTNHADHRYIFEEIKRNAARKLEAMGLLRDNPDSIYHPSRMDELTYEFFLAEVGAKLQQQKSDYVGRLTREFLIGHRRVNCYSSMRTQGTSAPVLSR